MLVVALNNIGAAPDNSFKSGFLKAFTGFQTVKLSPCADSAEKQLQICQPEPEEELLRSVLKSSDMSEPLLELQGSGDRLQKAVRSMFFPGRERKYEKFLLTGGDGITYFPWAVQIVNVYLPAPGWEQKLEWIRKADVIVLYGSESEESRRFTTEAKRLRRDVPIFMEEAGQYLSGGLKNCLRDLFAAYLKNRIKIKEVLEEQKTEQEIECGQARKVAETLGVDLSLVGSVCDTSGYRITRCGLGCF